MIKDKIALRDFLSKIKGGLVDFFIEDFLGKKSFGASRQERGGFWSIFFIRDFLSKIKGELVDFFIKDFLGKKNFGASRQERGGVLVDIFYQGFP